jgi:hypothetical protein
MGFGAGLCMDGHMNESWSSQNSLLLVNINSLQMIIIVIALFLGVLGRTYYFSTHSADILFIGHNLKV